MHKTPFVFFFGFAQKVVAVRISLCYLCVLCVSVVNFATDSITTETPKTQRLRREKRLGAFLCKAFFVCILSTITVTAQQTKPPSEQTEVIRVDASLVQTSVTVFDKRGTFVEGLRPQDFELRVDGKPLPISFLSRITAGTTHYRCDI
jgi:hypothetical protein